MKRLKLVLLLLISLLPGVAFPQVDCGCQRVMPDDDPNFKGQPENYEEKEAQAVIDSYRSFFFRQYAITASKYACSGKSAYAKLCGSTIQRYIFYNPDFLTRLRAGASQGDQFVLAHEIAHHLLGHTVRAYSFIRGKGQQEAIKLVYESTATIPERHLHELEADALALWLVIKKGAKHDDLTAIFKALPGIVPFYDRDKESDTHPSFAMRERMLERQWEKISKSDYLNRYRADKPGPGRNPRSIARKGNPIEEDTEGAYAFELRTADKALIKGLNEDEKVIRDSLTRHARFFADLVIGEQFQRPMLTRGNNTVATTDSRSLLGGIRLGVGPWYKASRAEIDVLLANSTFTTQALFGSEARTTERFNSTYLQVRPRYVYSRMAHRSVNYHNSGWMATAGLSVTVPLELQYVNYGVVAYQSPTQQATLAPVVGVGYGFSNWQNRNGHFRAWVLYQPQSFRFTTPAPDPIRATVHTISLELSARFW